MRRYAIGAVIGGLALFIWQPEPAILYDTVIVTRLQIVEREMPAGPPRLIERVKYVYLTPDVRAVAPGGAVADVARFCRPVLVDTASASPWVIRTVSHKSAFIPLKRDYLLLSSMNGNGDLAAEDYRVRPGYSATWGEQVQVRYPRWAPVTELGEGLLWYAGFRLIELVVR